MTADPTLPVVYLHIGTPKSGTSYLQRLLAENRAELEQQGLLRPGDGFSEHADAVRQLLRWDPRREQDPVPWSWRRLADHSRQWPGGKVVISMEWMASLRPEQAKSAVEAFAPCRVEVICTARDLARNVPAAWQERMQNGFAWSWQEFLEAVTTEDLERYPAASMFWRAQDTADIVRRWQELVPPKSFHLVTVPAAGADPRLLGDRFAEVLGVDASRLAPPPRANESLGRASAHLLWHVNRRIQEQGLERRTYLQFIKADLSKSVLAQRRGLEDPLVLPEQHRDWADQRARRMVDELRELDVIVHGELEDLLPVPYTGPDVGQGEPQLEDLFAAAVDGFAGLAAVGSEAASARVRETRRLRRQVRRLEDQLATAPSLRARAGHLVRRTLGDGAATRLARGLSRGSRR